MHNRTTESGRGIPPHEEEPGRTNRPAVRTDGTELAKRAKHAKHAKPCVLRSALLDDAGFAHGFPLRDTADGVLLDALGVERIVQVKQVHGARVVLAADAVQASLEGDALVSRASPPSGVSARSLAVGVRVADCVPVLVASVDTGDVAAIHAGWRGVVAGVVAEGVKRLGGNEWIAAIGPCIGPCCFEVGRDVAAQIGFVVREDPAAGAAAKAFVDLRAAVRAQLSALGVGRIDDVPGCTKHEADRFHSFRRDGANSGRMLAAIAPGWPDPLRDRP